MIKKLSIKNFKSIKELEIDCKRVNLFIGEPNVGKSNILEALGLISWSNYGPGLKEYVRFQGIQNLFYDDLIEQPVEIVVENSNGIRIDVEIKLASIGFQFGVTTFEGGKQIKGQFTCTPDYSKSLQSFPYLSEFSFIKFYKFAKQDKFPDSNPSFIRPPYGSNMFAVIWGNKNLRETTARFFKDFGFKPVFKPQEQTFEIQKQIEDMVVSYPYVLISDTLQRMIFYEIAMESNKDSTLIFEEPEAHTFPYYTKYLGERIGFDETNQYFIATHNPYLLLSILEKAKKDSVNVFITYFKDYQTKVKCLSSDEVSELMNYDPFANLNSFIEEKEQ
ncbi:MAG: AAA family ATPase [Candidatus Desantisbacteria bacterium]